jgi:hypothetical protein
LRRPTELNFAGQELLLAQVFERTEAKPATAWSLSVERYCSCYFLVSIDTQPPVPHMLLVATRVATHQSCHCHSHRETDLQSTVVNQRCTANRLARDETWPGESSDRGKQFTPERVDKNHTIFSFLPVFPSVRNQGLIVQEEDVNTTEGDAH